MATKADLRNMATKADFQNMVTKADIRDMATKADIKALREDLKHLETMLRMEMHLLRETLTVRLGGIVVLGVGTLAALNQL